MEDRILQQVKNNLIRQHKALQLLYSLLREEFDNLVSRDKSKLARQELAVQELMRQLAIEKSDLSRLCKQGLAEKGLPEAKGPFVAYLSSLPEEMQGPLEVQIQGLKQQEKACASQAMLNADLVMGLLDQSRRLLDFMRQTISNSLPKDTYTRDGGYHTVQCQPVAIRGRF